MKNYLVVISEYGEKDYEPTAMPVTTYNIGGADLTPELFNKFDECFNSEYPEKSIQIFYMDTKGWCEWMGDIKGWVPYKHGSFNDLKKELK